MTCRSWILKTKTKKTEQKKYIKEKTFSVNTVETGKTAKIITNDLGQCY